MVIKRLITFIALIEITIGLSTLSSSALYTYLSLTAKPLNVLVFVIAAAAVSTLLGIGLIHFDKRCAMLLVFFSGYIILTKLMIAGGLLRFNGEIMTLILAGAKNLISLLYHGLLLIFLTRPSVQEELR